MQEALIDVSGDGIKKSGIARARRHPKVGTKRHNVNGLVIKGPSDPRIL